LNAELYSMLADGTNLRRLTDDTASGAGAANDLFAAWQPAALAVTPTSLSFGDVVVNTPSVTRTVTLHAGRDQLAVSALAVAGAGAADFQVASETCTSAPVP